MQRSELNKYDVSGSVIPWPVASCDANAKGLSAGRNPEEQTAGVAHEVVVPSFRRYVKLVASLAVMIAVIGGGTDLCAQTADKKEQSPDREAAKVVAGVEKDGAQKSTSGMNNPYNGAQERETVFEFAEKPQVKKSGDKFTITFTSKAACDATVSILGPDTSAAGTSAGSARPAIVRHLASGVLGKNAPWPFQQNTLEQKIEWDGKDDLGQPAPAGCRVHVGLGFKPVFDGIYLDGPGTLNGSAEVVQGLTMGPDGLLYVHYAWWRVAAVGRDGKVAKYILPSDHKAIMASKFRPILERPDGTKFTLLDSARVPAYFALPAVYPGAGEGDRFCSKTYDLVVTRGGDILTGWYFDMPKNKLKTGSAGQSLFRIKADGVVPDDYYGPTIHEYMTSYASARVPCPVWCELSPDDKFVYVSGTRNRDNGAIEHCVYRLSVDPPARGQPEAWAGERGVAGKDEKHFHAPRGVAVDPKGLVYVADYMNDRIVVLKPDGSFDKAIPVERPECVAAGLNGEVYAVIFKPKNIPADLWKSAGYPGAFAGEDLEAKKVVRLAADGKVLASFELPKRVKMINGFIGTCDSPQIAVDVGATPPIIWIGNAAPRAGVWKLEDKGGEIVKVAEVPSSPDCVLSPGKDTPSIAASPYRQECWARTTGKPELARIGSDGKVERLSGVQATFMQPMADGSIWAGGSSGTLKHYDAAGQLVAGHKTLPIATAASAAWKGVRSMSSDKAGNLYVAYNLTCKEIAELRGPPPGKMPIRLNRVEMWRFAPDGTLKDKNVVGGFSARATTHIVGPNGDFYVGDGDFEPNEAIPLGLAGISKDWGKGKPFWKKGMASVFKFGPAGGEAVFDSKTGDYQPYVKATFTGLLWKVYGYSPNLTEADGCMECMCGSGRFSVDAYDRTIVPDFYTFSVHVIDGNGNRIATFGNYGNSEDRGPELRFTLGVFTAASSDAFWIADQALNRAVKAKWTYAAEQTVPAP